MVHFSDIKFITFLQQLQLDETHKKHPQNLTLCTKIPKHNKEQATSACFHLSIRHIFPFDKDFLPFPLTAFVKYATIAMFQAGMVE